MILDFGKKRMEKRVAWRALDGFGHSVPSHMVRETGRNGEVELHDETELHPNGCRLFYRLYCAGDRLHAGTAAVCNIFGFLRDSDDQNYASGNRQLPVTAQH